MAEDLLTKEQVSDVLKFAQALYGGNGFNMFNPDILNKNLSGININIKQPTIDELSKALGNPIDNQELLMGFNEWTEINDLLFKRVIEYYSNMLAFDLAITCSNAKGRYGSQEFKDDLDRVYSFLDKFDYKSEFAKMVKQMVRKESVFTFFRQDSNNKYILQQLPQKYCKITGKNEWTLNFDFDMSYFTNPATSVEQFPKCFTDYYIDVFKGGNGIYDYNPMNSIGRRDGSYTLWHQTDLEDGAWVFKFDDGMYANIPFLSPMIYETLITPIIRNMQKNKNIASAYAYLIGEIPFLNESKINKADQFAVDLTTLGGFLSMLKNGLAETIKTGVLPAKEFDMFQFEDKNKDMYKTQLATTSGLGAGASRLIYSDDRMSQSELENSIISDGNMMMRCYAQFENFLEHFINKKTRTFKFKFKFDNINYPFYRKQKIDNVMRLAENGVVLKPLIAQSFGISPQDFDRMLEATRAEGFVLESIHTKSEDKGGKPTQDVVGEAGEKTRNAQ